MNALPTVPVVPWPPEQYPDGPQEFRPTLRDRTYHALHQYRTQTRKTLKEIADEAGVSHGWLKMFAISRVDNPTVENIERLYFKLTGCRL